MEDWSGGEGQESFSATNRFSESDGIDVTTLGEIKLAPLVQFVKELEGPEAEHISDAVEDEVAWPQIIEWLGKLVIYNDRLEFDGGGLEFLEVFETDILQDQVIGTDTSGSAGVTTNDTRAEILSISKPFGLPGEIIEVTVKFKKPELEVGHIASLIIFKGLPIAPVPGTPAGIPGLSEYVIRYKLDFGGEAENQSENFAFQDTEYFFQSGQIELVTASSQTYFGRPYTSLVRLNREVIVTFSVRVPNKPPGIYKLWTSAAWKGAPFQKTIFQDGSLIPISRSVTPPPNVQDTDPASNANVLFFIQPVDQVAVNRRNLYAPQLKAATVVGQNLVGCRTVNSAGFLEVYQEQDGEVDRTLQIELGDVSAIIDNPTYFELIGSNGVVIAAFDNRIYKVDILTSGLTAAQRFTFIGTVPGTYASAMAVWNQRVYIASFDKSSFRSTITWTDLTTIQGSYDVDGKFWVTSMANFNGALFYGGGTELGEGRVFAFPANLAMAVKNQAFDARVRALNAGRLLYAGRSHGTGLITITERGAANYSSVDLGDNSTNVVWDIEEVGAEIYFCAGNALYKTVPNRYMASGFIESSEIGGNTPLIKKGWNSITVEARELNGDHLIRVLATHALRPDQQWTILGEMREEDGIEKQFTVPSDFQSQWIKWRIEISTTDPNTTPIIKRVLVKYIPDVLQKWQWVFAIRATDGLRLLDKQEERRSGEQVLDDLRDLKSLGTFRFRDIDEQIYNVILTDMKITRPVADKNRQEALVLLELLET